MKDRKMEDGGLIGVALKEWAVVCDFLAEGRCALLLRKGGVHERGGPGRFELDYERFALFPATEHERLDWVKPGWLKQGYRDRDRSQATGLNEAGGSGQATVRFRGWGEVDWIGVVPSRGAFDRLDDLHPWLAPQIDMRFGYKPDRPLYAVLVRAYRLAEPRVIAERDGFAGCVSWVPLEGGDALDVSGSEPAMEDAAFAAMRERVVGTLSG
ncbi:MAG: DUF1802 family protein [Planctomycetota bacterium]